MERTSFTTTLDKALLKEVKKLAIDLDLNVNKLIEEGMRMVLEKHGIKVKDGDRKTKP